MTVVTNPRSQNTAFDGPDHDRLASARIGQNRADVIGPDGRFPNLEVNRLGLSRGSGWLQYRWSNPMTKCIQLKVVYILKVDDHAACGSGYYKESPP
jgi:signal transduction histidine kinase